MDIKVNRYNREDGSLVFEVVITEPHFAPFDEKEEAIMNLLEDAKNKFDNIAEPENKARLDAERGIHGAKDAVFQRVLNSLQFAIKNQLEPKFKPICQEIYNWIYDKQSPRLQRWMSECDPQRAKYYFDNDKNIESDYEDD